MNILPELSAIAAAKYGLHLKDPIYKAFDKLVQDSRFELIKNPGQDDYAEIDTAMWSYDKATTTCTIIRNILVLIQKINGRKGYYTKKTTTPLEPRDTIFYWIDMLLKEFMNSGNGYSYDNHTRGSGVVNGIKMRAAIYYILDILNCENALYADAVTSGVMPSPYFFMGHDITQIVIHGTTSGVGTLDTYDGKYYVDVEIYDILKDVTTTLNICLGDSALGEGDTHTITSPSYSNYGDSFYRVTVKDFNCGIETNYTLTRENEITPGAVKEKTGTPPIKFYTVDTSLLDWVITGSVGGVGKVGKNKLKQKTTSIPNGAAGTWISGGAAWQDFLNGITFTTTAETTRIGMLFHASDNSNIAPSGVGNIMLVEGSTIPTTYDESTNLFKKTVMQGAYQRHNDVYDSETQMLYSGDDGKGGTNNYGSEPSFLLTRCKTYSQEVKANTTYSLRVFNTSYNNLEGTLFLFKEPGVITPEFMSLSNQKSIPGNETFNSNTEQWVALTPSHQRNTNTVPPRVAIDTRPMTFDYCESVADLKAGTYKLMVDIWTNVLMSDNLTIGCQVYSGCCDDNWTGTATGIEEFFALIKEDNTFAISKQNIFASGTTRKSKYEPYPNYHHREFEFTLDSDSKVGIFHKAYYTSTVYAYPAYFRFYIVNSNVVSESFTTTDVSPSNITGESAWEPYTVTVHVRVNNQVDPDEPGLAINTTIQVDDFLYDGDSISLTSTSTDIETFEGWNRIEVLSDIQPTIYIKYQQ